MDNERVSVRDKYERDEKGNSRGKTSGRKEKMKGGGGGDKKGIFKAIIVIAIIAFAIFVFLDSGGINLRTWDRTLSEDYANFQNSVNKFEDGRKNDFNVDDFYDKNRVYDDALLKRQAEKEYIVYVYTKNIEVDKPFNEWVKENEGEVPIYKISISDISINKEIRDYVEDGTPMFIVYNEVDKGVKSLEGIIKDTELFDEIIPKVDEYKAEKVKEREEEKERIKQNRKERREREKSE